MRHVKLKADLFIGDRTRAAGEVIGLDDKVADVFVNGGHGVIVPAPITIQEATIPPAPEAAVSRRGRGRGRGASSKA